MLARTRLSRPLPSRLSSSLSRAAAPLALALLATLGAAAAHAQSAYTLETYDGVTNRDEFLPGIGAFVSEVSSDFSLSSIAMLNDLATDGAMRFVIFEHNTHQLLYASAAKQFSDDGLSWKTSDPFAFTLQTGHQYDIGALANVDAGWAYDCCEGRYTESGLTTAGANVNFSNFAAPILSGVGQTLVPLRLVGIIPEPGTWALMLAGLAAVAWKGWRRRHHDDDTQ